MFNSPLVADLVSLALAEDLSYGDVTSELSVARSQRSVARILAKERLVVCGLPIISVIFDLMKSKADVEILSEEGAFVKQGEALAVITGSTRDLLGAERTILNFLQRLCGVATHTRSIVAKAQGLTLLDTRKTTPGWRVLEKYAAKIGGAVNHRFHLGDMILVKNNHVDAHGGDMRATLSAISSKKPRYMPMEVEVRDLEELKTALEFSPQVIMFDNMDDPLLRQAMKVVEKSGQSPMLEVSGGINEARFTRLRKLGVKCVSMGALTTQAGNVDISMRIESARPKQSGKRAKTKPAAVK